MNEYFLDERRIYAPAESLENANEGYPQLTTSDSGWTDEERNTMRERGYDGMDILMEWLS